MYLQGFLTEIGHNIPLPITVMEDNQACIEVATRQQYSSRLKHVQIKCQFVREQVTNGVIRLVYCNTKDQLADIMTKPLERTIFEAFARKLLQKPP